jgi:hypothetical protein
VEEAVDIILGLEAGGAGMQHRSVDSIDRRSQPFLSQISLNSVLLVLSSAIGYPPIFLTSTSAFHGSLRGWAYDSECKYCSLILIFSYVIDVFADYMDSKRLRIMSLWSQP